MHIFRSSHNTLEEVSRITGISPTEISKLNDQPEYIDADGRWHITDRAPEMPDAYLKYEVINLFRRKAVKLEKRAFIIEKLLIQNQLKSEAAIKDAQDRLNDLRDKIKDAYADAIR